MQTFIEAFKSRNSGRAPTQLATQTYDLLFLVKHLVEETKATGAPAALSDEREAFAKKLAALEDWKSISGPMSIVAGGYAEKPVTVLVFRGGKPERVSATN